MSGSDSQVATFQAQTGEFGESAVPVNAKTLYIAVGKGLAVWFLGSVVVGGITVTGPSEEGASGSFEGADEPPKFSKTYPGEKTFVLSVDGRKATLTLEWGTETHKWTGKGISTDLAGKTLKGIWAGGN